ncbi:hypothetical protein HMI49_16265 [Corallococcus exercitus]|uniref:TIR domain-containing protein n=1 Tax=Corallococcus exercitus TaxID=2316736 RepID=A0A7Y4KKS2_9BACT|nr:hypothetical protein [Corallococcus exercitus]NOK34754.1 hypothetical protein [Corallococcus exercitus]
MESVFLSLSFSDPDRDLVMAVDALIQSAGLRVVRGDALGGGAVSPNVKRLIEGADACVGIATPRDPLPNGRFSTHPWVNSEMVMAQALGKRCIALVEKSVDLQGAFSENERIAYDAGRPLPMITKLGLTLELWRREAGRQMKVLVLPASAAQQLAKNVGTAVCKYRYYNGRGQPGEWKRAAVVPQQGGPVVYLDGARDDSLVEVRLEIGRQSWCSPAIAPFTHVPLRKEPRP